MKRVPLLFLYSSFILLMGCSYLPEEVDLIAEVKLHETATYISLKPESAGLKSTGILFYPGGLVDPHAYIPTFQELAKEGHQVVIFKVAANLAILDAGTAQDYLQSFEGVNQWVLSGHSLGGVIAGIEVDAHPNDYVGLVLLASYPNDDLSTWNGTVLSLSASEDSLTTAQKIEENKPLLPIGIVVDSLVNMPIIQTNGQCIYHEIQGGNHAQFGAYGVQKDDGIATISRAKQQEEITAYIRQFFTINQWQ